MNPEQLEGPLWFVSGTPWKRFTRGLYKRGYRAAGYRRFVKKRTKRLMRRLGKKLGDMAPKKVPFRGWEW